MSTNFFTVTESSKVLLEGRGFVLIQEPPTKNIWVVNSKVVTTAFIEKMKNCLSTFGQRELEDLIPNLIGKQTSPINLSFISGLKYGTCYPGDTCYTVIKSEESFVKDLFEHPFVESVKTGKFGEYLVTFKNVDVD